jgi:hypothetical protein
MSQVLGADLADLDRLSKKFDAARRTIEGSRDAMNGQMLDTRRWIGRDADDARSVWKNQSVARMTEVAQVLVTYSTKLQKQIAEQRGASAVDSGLGASIGGGSVGAGLGASGSADLGHGVGAPGTIGASILTGTLLAGASAGRTGDGYQANASTSAEGDLVKVGANGQVGNKYVNASGSGEAKIDARANADGKAAIGLDGAAVSGGAGLFVGGEATADGKVDLGGITPEVSATASYGFGAHADASASINFHEIKASVDIGASLGIGGGVKFDIDVNPGEVGKNIGHFIGSIL